MKTLTRVVWSEGMHLGPHHFQAQVRYFEDLVHFTMAALRAESWGYFGLRLDEAALSNGILSLIHARGVFRDGLVFAIPESDAPPPPRTLADIFPAMRDTLEFHLAIPPLRFPGPNCGEEPLAAGVRFGEDRRELSDELTGRDAQAVALARKNIRLLAENEIEGEQTLPVARIRRTPAGEYALDERFIAPVLRLDAAPRLMVLLATIIELLEQKCRTLARPKDLAAGTTAGFSAQGISNAWFLHAVNASLGPLRHFAANGAEHPESLYRELARLAGALCTFGLDSHPDQLPLYDHGRPENCFDGLSHHIRAHLELVVPSNCVSFPLTQTANYFWEAPVADDRTLVRSRWIFAIRCQVGEAELINATPRLVKICSKSFVPKLVSRALPGLTLRHLPVPPPAINPRVDFQYFAMDKAGPCWDHIVQTREVGVYVPGELPGPEIELMAVLES
ncbi:MAG: type VI secretion system baseplate subunit TssK [Bryobacter sp.]|jgi:type VI secretion system protein ImpJ|nr:type VI secretion system baseplate subunit TssK [Bryobacter sp.]